MGQGSAVLQANHMRNASCRQHDDCPLAEVMYEVPLLLENLPSDAHAALSCCNRQLWHMFHDFTTTISGNTTCDLPHITNGRWSNLALIVYKAEEGSFAWPRHGNLQLLALLNFAHGHGQLTEMYLIVSNKRADCQQQARMNSLCIAQAFGYMHNHLQQSFSRLEMSIRQGELSAQIMAQLVKLFLPCLTLLDLDNNTLYAAATACLAQACWPMLDALYLTNTTLDATSAEHLAKSKWPLLQVANLSCNQLDNTAMLHLSRAHWPELQALCLKDNSFDGIGVQWLTEGRWQKLNDLTLDSRAAYACTGSGLRLPAVSWQTRCFSEQFTVSRDLGDLADPNWPQVVWPHLKEVHFYTKRLHRALQLITRIILALAVTAFYIVVGLTLDEVFITVCTKAPSCRSRMLVACVISHLMPCPPLRMPATIAIIMIIARDPV